MLGIRILIRLDQDLFGQIQILGKSFGNLQPDLSASQSNWNQSYSESVGYEKTDFTSTVQLRYSTDSSFETADF
jgi:hypothetical protein